MPPRDDLGMSTDVRQGLTPEDIAAVDEFHRRLAQEFPEIEIISVAVKEGAVDIRLSDNAHRDMATFHRTTELAVEVEDNYPGVCLLPRTVGHGS
jgi:hypothetical protein